MENEKSILSIEIFMEMIHNYVKDNVGLFNTDTSDNSAMNITIQKLFPDMQLENGGMLGKLVREMKRPLNIKQK